MSHNHSAAHPSRNRLVIVFAVTWRSSLSSRSAGWRRTRWRFWPMRADAFPANHVRKHMATSSPMSVGFEVAGDQWLVTRLTDAE